MSASPPLHFLFILHSFAWCSCFLSGEAVGSGPQEGTVLPGKGQIILPGGCQAWLSSRGSWGCGEGEAQSQLWARVLHCCPMGRVGRGGTPGSCPWVQGSQEPRVELWRPSRGSLCPSEGVSSAGVAAGLSGALGRAGSIPWVLV